MPHILKMGFCKIKFDPELTSGERGVIGHRFERSIKEFYRKRLEMSNDRCG